jgi:glycosyltransferase involved in cell wall biosynthesis
MLSSLGNLATAWLSPERAAAMIRARRVVVASRIYTPEAGAAAFRLAALVQELCDSGFATTVLTTRSALGTCSSDRVRRWPVLRDRTGAVRGYLQYASFDIPLFFRLLTCPRPGVVVAEPPPTTGVVCRIVCRLRRVPYVYFSADVTSSAARGIGVNRFVVAVVRSMERWVLRGAAAVLAVSTGVRDEVIALGAAAGRVTDVGTGIDTDLFSRKGTSASVGYPYLIYAGTMSEVHGASVFIEAFGTIAAAHPTARLLMFGQGVELESLITLAAKIAPGRVDFPGVVDGGEIARWTRGAHAGLASVRPARGYDFAYATKAFASISCGTPVIYAGVGPARKQVDDNDLGWSVDWDSDQVAGAMDAALQARPDDATRERLSRWAEQNHSLRSVAGRAAAVVSRVAAQATP